MVWWNVVKVEFVTSFFSNFYWRPCWQPRSQGPLSTREDPGNKVAILGRGWAGKQLEH